MNKKSLYIFLGILAIVVIGVFIASTIFVKGLEPLRAPDSKCTSMYNLSDETKLSNNQSEFTQAQIDWFFYGKCPNGKFSRTLWTQEDNPNYKDETNEKVYYCDDEKQFIVVKSKGPEGIERHLLTGIPCEELT